MVYMVTTLSSKIILRGFGGQIIFRRYHSPRFICHVRFCSFSRTHAIFHAQFKSFLVFANAVAYFRTSFLYYNKRNVTNDYFPNANDWCFGFWIGERRFVAKFWIPHLGRWSLTSIFCRPRIFIVVVGRTQSNLRTVHQQGKIHWS